MKLVGPIVAAVGWIALAVAAAMPAVAQGTPVPGAQRDTQLALSALVAVEAPVKSYRDPGLRQRSVFPVGSPVRLYLEPVNLTRKFVTKLDGSRELQGLMVIDAEIYDRTGRIVKSGKGVLRLPIVVKVQSPEEVREFDAGRLHLSRAFANIDFDPKLPAGSYTVKLRVNDGQCATCKAEGAVTVEIQAPGSSR